MNIRETFSQSKSRNETVLVAYETGGYPSLRKSMENIRVISGNGADIIEIGIPFSDPIADGPVIQASSHAALEKGASLAAILEAISGIQTAAPLVAMSYLNPLLAYGSDRVFTDMKSAGFSGVIIPDLPLEESAGWKKEARDRNIDLIFLVTPTTSPERLKLLADASEGFIYCVSLTGTTGTRKELPSDLAGFIAKVKALTDKPVAVGFGISTPDHIRQLRGKADGVIVGSRIVKAMEKKQDIAGLVRRLKKACCN